MIPRSLRHRFEKAAKLLVIVQKHAPDVDCRLDEDRGDNGTLIVNFSSNPMNLAEMDKLGRDLEGRGYRFKAKNCTWLGQKAYTGKATDKPDVILTLPSARDRVTIDEQPQERPHSFGSLR